MNSKELYQTFKEDLQLMFLELFLKMKQKDLFQAFSMKSVCFNTKTW